MVCAVCATHACTFDPSGLVPGAAVPDAATDPLAPDADSAEIDAAPGSADASPADAGLADADTPDAGPGCDLAGLLAGMPFDVELVANVNSPDLDRDPFVTADGKTLYFMSAREGGQGGQDIWRATRESRDAPFSAPVNVTELNSSVDDTRVSLTEDQLTAVLASARESGFDVFQSERASIGEAFSTPTRLGLVTTSADDHDPAISLDGLRLYLSSDLPDGPGNRDIVLSARGSLTAPFPPAESLANVNTGDLEADPAVTADELVIMFTKNNDIHYATRASVQEDFSTPMPLTGLNTGASAEDDPFVTADGCELFFASDRQGGVGNRDIYRVRLDRPGPPRAVSGPAQRSRDAIQASTTFSSTGRVTAPLPSTASWKDAMSKSLPRASRARSRSRRISS